MESSESKSNVHTLHASKWWIAFGIFLITLAIYVLFNAGRIDIIDGQARYDAAYNWLTQGRPEVLDPWIKPFMGVRASDGHTYSFYGAAGSAASLPLVWFGIPVDSPTHETSRFLFSLTSSFFGAAVAAIMFAFYLELGVSPRVALVWTLVSAFATLTFVLSTSTFDNAQHAFFVIAAVYLGFLSVKDNSRMLAALSGLLAGALLLYQEYFILLLPIIALSTVKWISAEKSSSQDSVRRPESKWSSRMRTAGADFRALFNLVRLAFRGNKEARASLARCLFFCAGVGGDLVLYFAYNSWRFGSIWDSGKHFPKYPPMWGNPVAGLGTLLVSPGKSVFLYSPPIILGLIGISGLRRRKPEISFVIITASVVLICFLSFISFPGGDWCWGPRYLVPLLPLWGLAFPFGLREGRIRRDLVLAIVGMGLIVQVLALSVENQRFFFQRGVNDFFWAEDPWFYFKHSALAARVSETMSLSNGPPASAHLFSTIPMPGWTTYTILGPPPPRYLAPQWMRNYRIYYLPRPWPFWMQSLKPGLRPVNLEKWLWGLLGMLLAGLTLIYRGLRNGNREITPHQVEMKLEMTQQ